ncbi:MAG: T9SS type A sorting domain-containing protein [Saprospiraceae bacterium]
MNNRSFSQRIISFIIMFCCISHAIDAQVIYVNSTSNGNGTSWADATSDLRGALENATAGMQIWLAAGTYYPTQCSECTEADRLVAFEIPNGVSIIGGYVEVDDEMVRDWQNHPTILSGNIDQDTTSDFNSYNVILTKNVNNSTSVDGITIAGGNANSLIGGSVRTSSGAGWYNESSNNGGSSNPLVSNCTFINNAAAKHGGGMHNEGGFGGSTRVFYNNCKFINNQAEQAGGAVYNQASFAGKSTSKFSNCLFEENQTAGEGGAIYSNGSEEGSAEIQIISCNFNKNTAVGRAGAIYNHGNNRGHCNATLIGCNFTENKASDAGAILNDGGFEGESSPTITGCYFKDNQTTGKGGAVLNDGNFGGQSHAVFTNCTFDKNMAGSNGGGVYSDGSESGNSHPTFENCQFFNNVAQLGGATFQFGKNGRCEPIFKQSIFVNNEAEEGAGLYNDASFNGKGNFIMENCRFSNNHSFSNGGAMYNLGTSGGEIKAHLTNCTFDNNYSGFAGAGMFNSGIEGNCSPTLINCKFVGNYTDTYGGAMYNQGKAGNASPTLINCLFSKNTAFSAGGIYNLGAEFGNSSPIITNCTFYGNRAHVGGAVYSNAAEENIGTAAPQITNCIFYKNFANFGDVFRIINGNPTINYCQFDKPDCASLYSGIDGQVTCGEGLIFLEEPMFIDTSAGNFHLQENAPGIDQGDNSVIMAMDIVTDLDNHPRIQNGRVDLGVYEVVVEDNETSFQVLTTSIDQNLCAGTDTHLEVNAIGTAPFFYQWFQDQNAVPAATAATLNLINVNENDRGSYYCRVINAAGDTLSSDFIQINIQPEINVNAQIFVEKSELCTGEEAYFWAETAGGGEAPIYDWRINGNSQNSNSNTFISSNLMNGDLVELNFISSENCPSVPEILSDDIMMQVSPNLNASINIEAAQTTICVGEITTFSAFAENSGEAPIYQWLLNGTPIGANEPTISLQLASNSDQVRCQLTSSLTCIENNPILSDAAEVVINDQVQPQISISTDSLEFCLGSTIAFTATTENGGDSPFYQWSVNSIITDEGEAVFVTDNLRTGDIVNCLLISSAACVTEPEITSNSLTVNTLNCTTSVSDSQLEKNISITPNPARDFVQIELPSLIAEGKYIIYNLQGKRVQVNSFQRTSSLNLSTKNLAPNSYLIQLHLDGLVVYKRLVIQ